MNCLRQGLAALLLGAASLPLLADDVRCLQSTGSGKPIRLSLTLLSDEQGQHRTGYVRYAGQPDSLPLVFKSSEILDDEEGENQGRPWEYLSTWLEILPAEERIGGRYSFHHQGAVLFDFQYLNLRSGKTYHFAEDRDALDELNTCVWP
ncbi:hypothetical protein [Phytopseudomonas dryadis]|uniref:Secreted protein n=1 Tax=Phytopseudomonas dryadis TaxID=2487520 RepID=A0A4Q9R1D2_9GAMM|nr:hypothetical protein [Pseudomonas dryadis]TBU92778.1 hypothetical protein DNK44_11980 [Pseudomonas dryadis]